MSNRAGASDSDREPSAGDDSPSPVPEATVARLPVYLRAVVSEREAGATTISSERLAKLAGVNAAKVRKDLSFLGTYGIRGVGYDVDRLMAEMGNQLGLSQNWPCVIVGAGNLGAALANYLSADERGFSVVAIVDADEAKWGEHIGSVAVHADDDLPRLVAEHDIAIGIITTPPSVAQTVADQLVAAGVGSILNFAPVVLTIPDGVLLRNVDLALELQVLSFYQGRSGEAAAPA
ncbi:MAG: redox-sensing transcriptional repressor Rex [Microthrixaceae bacterium]|nr:redox-sensing transcriptional repressor Rex [Microthrixaceae bacterium]